MSFPWSFVRCIPIIWVAILPRQFLVHKNKGVKTANDRLKKEKQEYSVIFGELTGACDASLCAPPPSVGAS